MVVVLCPVDDGVGYRGNKGIYVAIVQDGSRVTLAGLADWLLTLLLLLNRWLLPCADDVHQVIVDRSVLLDARNVRQHQVVAEVALR